MTTVSMNCCGLAAATTSRELQDLIKVQKPAILFLLEIRAQKERVDRVRRKLKFQNMFCIPALGTSVGWDYSGIIMWKSRSLIREKLHSFVCEGKKNR